jgi:microcin C transport system substrate-binding protein
MKKLSLLALLVSCFPALAHAECGVDSTCSHGLAIYGEPKYDKDFTHFDYTNPDAPKGGDITFAAVGTFDTLNGNILKGVAAAGVSRIYDTLIVDSGDESFTKYGLLARTIELANDHSWVAFHLRKEAKFHDGTPITAADVVFSFNTLTTKGHPYYKSYYREVSGVEAVSSHVVKFSFSNSKNRELPLILGQIPILPKHYYDTHDFTKASLDIPLGSGAYKVAKVEPGKWIRYERVDDYWGKDLPVNKGRYNFDSVTHDYYRDATVAVEAFKAGEYDLRQENISKTWASAYDFSAVKDGRVIKEEIEHQRPTGMQGFVYNLRKDLFDDIKVREALGYVFDFEWTNKTLFHGAYNRTNSFFSNSEFASSGLPKGRELAVLKQFKDKLPASTFTKEFTVPHTKGSGNNRTNLIKAKNLLKETAWQMKDGKLQREVNGEWQLFEFEFLLSSPSFERVIAPMIKSLKKLGIKATMRTVDSAQYVKRLEDFDFDVVVNVVGQSLNPGNEQQDYWHSGRADVAGTRNIGGIKNDVVDELVALIPRAETKEDLVAYVQALDRVLLSQHYVIPQWHFRKHRVIFWNRFSRPEIQENYLLGLDNWWVDGAKDAALKK